MIFKPKSKYELPTFPPEVRATFKKLCKSVPLEKIAEIRDELDQCVVSMENEAKTHTNMNIELARKLAERSRYLLDNYEQFDSQGQALAMGAVHYFAIAQDPISDTAFAGGFDDDAKVMNYVLQELGIEGLFL